MERLKRQAEREEDERIMEEERKEKEKRIERQKERQKKEFNVKVRWSKGNHFNQQTLKDIFCKVRLLWWSLWSYVVMLVAMVVAMVLCSDAGCYGGRYGLM